MTATTTEMNHHVVDAVMVTAQAARAIHSGGAGLVSV